MTKNDRPTVRMRPLRSCDLRDTRQLDVIESGPMPAIERRRQLLERAAEALGGRPEHAALLVEIEREIGARR